MGRDDRSTREIVALEAARIMFDEHSDDVNMARRKAAQKMGTTQRQALPSNQEIEDAYRQHVTLFGKHEHVDTLRELRQTAVRAMELLAPFKPKLVGPVLDGTAHPHSAIELHLLAPTAEDVGLFLFEHKIPYREGEARLQMGGNQTLAFPMFNFVAQTTPIELTVFTLDGIRNTPTKGPDNQVIRRANIASVRALIG